MIKPNYTCIFLLIPVNLASIIEIQLLKCFLTKLIGLKLSLELFDLLRAACLVRKQQYFHFIYDYIYLNFSATSQ